MDENLGSTDRFRSRCRWVARLMQATALLLVLFAGSTIMWPVLKGSRLTSDHLLGSLMFVAPAIFYVAALWFLSGVFTGVAKGERFSQLLPGALRRAGVALIAGALTSVVGVMLLYRALTGSGSYIHLDIPGIVLACVGAGLVLLATLLDEARALQAELDEML